MRVRARVLLFLATTFVSTSFSSETVRLMNGFELSAKSHTVDGTTTTLQTETGTISIASAEIASIEIRRDPLPKVAARDAQTAPRTALDVIHEAAARQGNAPEFDRLVRSVAIAESGLNPNAVSVKGALGLMQLMPATAQDLGVSPRDPDQNARGGAKLLAGLLEKYHYDSVRALAAYNAGAEAVKRYGGVPPFAETQAYVRRVLKIYGQLTAAESPKSKLLTP